MREEQERAYVSALGRRLRRFDVTRAPRQSAVEQSLLIAGCRYFPCKREKGVEFVGVPVEAHVQAARLVGKLLDLAIDAGARLARKLGLVGFEVAAHVNVAALIRFQTVNEPARRRLTGLFIDTDRHVREQKSFLGRRDWRQLAIRYASLDLVEGEDPAMHRNDNVGEFKLSEVELESIVERLPGGFGHRRSFR